MAFCFSITSEIFSSMERSKTRLGQLKWEFNIGLIVKFDLPYFAHNIKNIQYDLNLDSLLRYKNRHFITFFQSYISSTPVVVNFKFTSIMGTETVQSLLEKSRLQQNKLRH